MMTEIRKLLAGVFTAVGVAGSMVLAGCATSGDVGQKPQASQVRQITQSAHCGLTGPGLAYVQSAEELQQLLELPAQNMAVQQLRQVNLDQEYLVFVTLGEKPTGGYSASLVSASADADTGNLQLTMDMRSPAPGAMVTQALTSPCVVVAVPASDWSQILVSGIRDRDLILEP
ncbi:protease complex subunit PrcB family protein [Marinobacter adhaerens]|uniref:Protease complex subunit PrcB family protein n=1 Tax=Marinobacter adhaerens TaxID=1033846 RepID=A0A851HQG1_9GAMM|nr:protease complex subunit PrcB family protein [Marinobacter adhaerens]NWN91253.1 protease complex subunit PrcB family protein [Marinobacter adhaerens]